MALTKITGQVVDTTTDLVVGVTTVGGGVSAVDGFFSGIITAVGNASFSGSVSVGGTLTYEDVTNIDSVGLITARNGIVVGASPGVAASISVDGNMIVSGVTTFTGADVLVGTGISLSPDGDASFTGIVTFTGADVLVGTGISLSSDGDASFTGIVTATTFKGDGQNITGSTIRPNLTFGSDLLNISSTTSALGLRLTNTGNEYTNIQFSAARTGADSALGILNAKWNNTHEVAAIYLTAGDDTTNKDDGKIKFYTSAASGSLANRMEILNDGDVKITDGDLVIGTSGHGIDFSATSDGSGSMSSEILDDYEEGLFTPTITSGGSSITYTIARGSYTKIGDLVEFQIDLYISGTADGNNLKIGGLPFTSANQSTKAFGGAFLNYNNAAFGDLGDRVLFHIASQNTYIQLYNSVTGNVIAGNSTGVALFSNKEICLTGVYQAS